jgi:hypothetical protein
MYIKDKVFLVEVPKESTEYRIDDFLGNILQYKIGEEWIYETTLKLPRNDIEILGVVNDDEYISLNIDKDKKWLKIKNR